jgi:SAM-dependent methyltransferase
MGFIGGSLGYRILKKWYPGGTGVPMPAGDPFREKEISKLKLYFGESIYEELRDKTVADFGSGQGWQCVELALNGVRNVIGLDIVPAHLESGRRLAAEYGVSGQCSFVSRVEDKVDVVLSIDAFEHFEDPAAILRKMRDVVKDDGLVLISFGYTWYHPLGGHLFSVFPWAHLIFTEEALMRWRSEFKTDGATRFGEIEGGLNQMSVARWERLLQESPFEVAEATYRPISAARRLYCRLTRELFTSTMQFRLRPR